MSRVADGKARLFREMESLPRSGRGPICRHGQLSRRRISLGMTGLACPFSPPLLRVFI
jgi:hypothetical protein